MSKNQNENDVDKYRTYEIYGNSNNVNDESTKMLSSNFNPHRFDIHSLSSGVESPNQDDDNFHEDTLRERIKKKFYSSLPDQEIEINDQTDKANQTAPIIHNNSMSLLNHKPSALSVQDNNVIQKISELDSSINQLNARNAELAKVLNDMRKSNSSQEIKSNPNQDSNSMIIYELQKMKQEQSALVSDNIIFREDINRLTDINRHLEIDLANQRQRNYELANENDKLNKENLNLHMQIDKTNSMIAQVRTKEHNLMENINQRLTIETKMQNQEYELKALREKHSTLEIDHNLLLSKYNDLYIKNEKNENELNLLNQIQSEKIVDIESKLCAMSKEIEILRRENDSLRKDNEKYRCDIKSAETMRDSFKEKYHEQKCKNDLLNEKLNEINEEFKAYKEDLALSEMKRIKEEEIKRCKLESKNKILCDLQKRITNYKNDRIKKKDSDNNKVIQS